MLPWKLMKATELACRNVCDGEEVAFHYHYTLNRFDRLRLWSRGFVAGWLEEEECISLSVRFRRKICRRRREQSQSSDS